MFEVIATTHLDHIDQLEHMFDLNVAPPVMVRALGRCIGVDLLDPGLDETVQREVLIEMGSLARLQGTKRRLTRVLELVTRERVEVIDSGAVVIEGVRHPHRRTCGSRSSRPAGWTRTTWWHWCDASCRRRSRSSCGWAIGRCGPSRNLPRSTRRPDGLPPVRHADRARRAAHGRR